MSSEAAGDDEDLEPVTFILMRAEDTFDGQERVMSRAAYDLQVRATAHSASCGHPGYVPDDYLEHLTASASRPRSPRRSCAPSAPGNASTAATASWTGKPSNMPSTGYASAQGEDPEALAAERDHEAKSLGPHGHSRWWSPRRARHAELPSARIELVAPGQLPAEWDQWPSTVQDSIVRQREPGQWYLLFKGIATYNGYGDPIDASRAGRIAQAFRPPLRFAQVHTAGFYDDAGFCQDCDAPYCYQHWHVSETGYGYCPRGHGKSLDPTALKFSVLCPIEGDSTL